MTAAEVCAVLAVALVIWAGLSLVRGAVIPAIVLAILACLVGPGGYWLLG